MGSSNSTTSDKQKEPIKFTDYSRVKIPKGHKLIKMATYNVALRNGINMQFRIDHTIDYIFSSLKNKDIDIICLQGINDYNSAYALIQDIKVKMKKMNKSSFYFAPDFEEVQIKTNSIGKT